MVDMAILDGLFDTGFISVRLSQAAMYRETALYYRNRDGKFLLYKPPGESLPDSHAQKYHHPALFIRDTDRISAITELQGTFTTHLKDVIKGDNAREIKDTLVNLVQETLSEPRAGVLKVLPETVSLVVEQFSSNRNVIRSLMFLSDSDYSTAIHAVNVMALTISYCNFTALSTDESSELALMALLHDLGKTQIPAGILKSAGKLTPAEFLVMKSHPKLGAEIIHSDPDLANRLSLGAMEHHEKLDGSGYPNRITNISFAGRLIGLVDCYEALTGDERPYRRAKPPLETLHLLKQDVVAGKLDQKIFTDFCRSLIP